MVVGVFGGLRRYGTLRYGTQVDVKLSVQRMYESICRCRLWLLSNVEHDS